MTDLTHSASSYGGRKCTPSRAGPQVDDAVSEAYRNFRSHHTVRGSARDMLSAARNGVRFDALPQRGECDQCQHLWETPYVCWRLGSLPLPQVRRTHSIRKQLARRAGQQVPRQSLPVHSRSARLRESRLVPSPPRRSLDRSAGAEQVRRPRQRRSSSTR